MATLKSFEDIEVWQKARTFAGVIYSITNRGSLKKDFELKNQINKSCGSIMDNIAEGFERGGNREFIMFLSIAKGSAGEVRSQLYRAFDRNHISTEDFENLKSEIEIITRQISGLINYLKNSELKGPKFVREPEENYKLNLEL